MSEKLLREYGGLVEITRRGRYEIHEDGRLLATADSEPVADKLFFKRALDAACIAAGDMNRCRLTDAGRTAYLGKEPEKTEPEKPKKETKRFVKPTVEEVEAYCRERGNTVDAAAFIDHYEANGWMAGRVKMKDWKAAVRTWERKEYQTSGKGVKTWVAATQPTESSLDIEGYEAELLGRTPVFSPKEETA